MLNPIYEMRRLNCMPYQNLMQIAIDKYSFCPDCKNVSKVELITYIIASAAMHGDKEHMTSQEGKSDNKRTRFVLNSNGDTFHIMLTKEQIDFLDWCFENNIDFGDAIADKIQEVHWEMP